MSDLPERFRRHEGESDHVYFLRMQPLAAEDIDTVPAEVIDFVMEQLAKTELAPQSEPVSEQDRDDQQGRQYGTSKMADEPTPEPEEDDLAGEPEEVVAAVKAVEQRKQPDADSLPPPSMDEVEELLQQTGLVKPPRRVKEPHWSYHVLDGTEAIEEADKRSPHIKRRERNPMMRALMEREVLFVPGETPHSLSDLYRQCRRREFKVSMRHVRVDGEVGTLVRHAGWTHMWSAPYARGVEADENSIPAA